MDTVVQDVPFDRMGGYRVLMADRNGFQRLFCEYLLKEYGLDGRILDIGCGSDIPNALRPIANRFRQMDGVDPSPGVLSHPLLKQRWHAPFESAPIPEGTYDLALAYNVVEHIADPFVFMRKVCRVLKPGGVFWCLTPHANHPFCYLVRLVQVLHIRRAMRESIQDPTGRRLVNEYPAYYRMNRRTSVLRAIVGLPIRHVVFHYFPSMQWDTYWPSALRWMAHLYDAALGTRIARFALLFGFRLETAGGISDGVTGGVGSCAASRAL